MSVQLDFVKGHCGWDVVTLLPAGQIPLADELAASVKIVSAPLYGGLEAGWMERGDAPGEIRLRMVNSTTRNWIPMCGGMSQVIGKALVETFLREHFEVDTSRPELGVTLLTPSGAIPVRVEIHGGKAASVTTTMDNYLAYLYREGIEPVIVNGVPFLKVGRYAVIDVRELEKVHPGLDFARRDPGPHLEVVNGVLRAFRTRLGLSGVNGMLYDDRPEGPGGLRVFPRFYSDDLAAARIPGEFQCGTGSIAVAVALASQGRISATSDRLVLEWGSLRATPDPYGIRTSMVEVAGDGRRLVHAAFSHSVVEILAEGRLTLPGY